MPNPITSIEFRFDQEHCSKDGMFFQGPLHLLALPREGESFDLDRPAGMRGRVLRQEAKTMGRFTEVVLHCVPDAGDQETLTGVLTGHPLITFVRNLFRRP